MKGVCEYNNDREWASCILRKNRRIPDGLQTLLTRQSYCMMSSRVGHGGETRSNQFVSPLASLDCIELSAINVSIVRICCIPEAAYGCKCGCAISLSWVQTLNTSVAIMHLKGKLLHLGRYWMRAQNCSTHLCRLTSQWSATSISVSHDALITDGW